MVTDIERQFFETFGIEPSTKYDYCWKSEENKDKLYPQISDRILLELICILSKYKKDKGSLLEIYNIRLNELKEEILEKVIFRNKDLNYQVQSLFKEG